MDSKLLVRVYNVGLGYCTYLRVPDLHRDVHILIDCGNRFAPMDLLGRTIKHLKKELPGVSQGKKRLDLLVATQPNDAHCKGFEEEFFSDIEIDQIWLSPAFDHLNPRAQGLHALQAASQRGLRILSEKATGEMKVDVDELLSQLDELLVRPSAESIDVLCHGLHKGILPRYVTADTPNDQLEIFDDPTIKFKVLAPMGDIDNYYVGGDGLANFQGGLATDLIVAGYRALFPSPELVEVKQPSNISTLDFKQLRRRVPTNALALADVAVHTMNNLSVVLLLEWHGRRLLFPGDAEWSGKNNIALKPGKSNSSWNVMWQERHADLAQPLDFLMIGHHGSENATPWAPADTKGNSPAINQILDALLPETGNAYAVVSTERTERWPSIPNAALMETLGKRVVNARTEYVEEPGDLSVKPGIPQPQRTDLEAQVTGSPVKYIDVTFQEAS